MEPKIPYKRIIICCDGTWQASDRSSTGTSQDSNVTKFSRALSKTATVNGQTVPQIVYYVSGIGTTGFTKTSQFVAGGLGLGLSENVIEAYNFLALNYEPQDEIFLLGFSRGAYTARALAGLISTTGILKRECLDNALDLYKAYKGGEKALTEFEAGSTTLEYKKERAKIKVVGCWDTVGSLGIPASWFTWASGANKHDSFHDTKLSNKIENAFHALSLDEYRKPFSPTLWNLPKDSNTNLVQCWFPGVHTSVGGGNGDVLKDKDGPFEQLADITFTWMVEMCQSLLQFNPSLQKDIFDRNLAMLKKGGPKWGLGNIKDSYTWYYYPTGKLIRSPGQYNPEKDNESDLNYVAKRSREYMHSTVRVREGVHPRGDALKGFHQMKDVDATKPDTEAGKDGLRSGRKWVKELGNGKMVEIPEMRILGKLERSLMQEETQELVSKGLKED